ncbi:MAG: Hsp20/alpha crystallin family protein [Desulfomonilaceae bacterium]
MDSQTDISWECQFHDEYEEIETVSSVTINLEKLMKQEGFKMFYWGTGRDPIWFEFNRIQRNLDDLVRRLDVSNRAPFEPWLSAARIFPAINVAKVDDSYVVTAEIPGIMLEDLEIKVEGDTLTVRGERKPENLGEGVSYHRKERVAGTFQRSLTLPTRVEADEVKARYAEGVLTISLPIEKTAQPKQITVTTE